MNNSNTKMMQSLEKDFEAQIKLNSIVRHLNKPILDTLQKNWDVERVLYFSFSGTTLSDTLVCKKMAPVQKKWHPLQKKMTPVAKKNVTRCKKNDTPQKK